MAKKDYPSIDVLEQVLEYHHESGKFYWKTRPIEMFEHLKHPSAYFNSWNKVNAGKEAFTAKEKHGYKHGTVFGIPVKAHIIAFMLYHKRLPDMQIDHINGLRDDNRICNLREAERCQNIQNQKIRPDNKSGYKGVIWSKEKQKFRVEIQARGKRFNLGYFLTAERAALAYNKAAKELHNEFAFLNDIKS